MIQGANAYREEITNKAKGEAGALHQGAGIVPGLQGGDDAADLS